MEDYCLWKQAVCEELGLDQDRVVSIRTLESENSNRVDVVITDDGGRDHHYEFTMKSY